MVRPTMNMWAIRWDQKCWTYWELHTLRHSSLLAGECSYWVRLTFRVVTFVFRKFFSSNLIFEFSIYKRDLLKNLKEQQKCWLLGRFCSKHGQGAIISKSSTGVFHNYTMKNQHIYFLLHQMLETLAKSSHTSFYQKMSNNPPSSLFESCHAHLPFKMLEVGNWYSNEDALMTMIAIIG